MRTDLAACRGDHDVEEYPERVKAPCVGDVDGRWRGFTGRVRVGDADHLLPCDIDRLLSGKLFMRLKPETSGRLSGVRDRHETLNPPGHSVADEIAARLIRQTRLRMSEHLGPHGFGDLRH